MKTEKLSLSGIKNVLSRAELKKIMAGSGGLSCGSTCDDLGRDPGCPSNCLCGIITSGQGKGSESCGGS